ncbi:MAG: lipid A deacylase LpxR family protein [Bacteroidota bacterium]
MKKGIVFFFLLIFSQCHDIKDKPSSLRSDPGQKRPLYYNDSPDKKDISRTKDTFTQKTIFTAGKISKNRKKHKEVLFEPEFKKINPSNAESTFIRRLNYLRSGGIELDFNEPVSRQFMSSHVENQQFQTMITLSRESFLTINYDNDILDNTDRYYTNGIKIDLISPGLQMNPLSKLMIPYWGTGKNYYGITLVQNIYTPSTTKTGGILYGDRPYAAYLYIGSFKITNDPDYKFRQTSEIDVGIIGPDSYGEWVQGSFHKIVPTNNEPLGWEYQIQNDLVLNYSIAYEKGIFSGNNIDLNLNSIGSIGTLYTGFTGGFQFRAGWMNPYFANLGLAKKTVLKEQGLRKFQFIFFVKGSGKLVGYDATLEGGLLNKTNSYTLSASEISRVVFQSSGGISVSSGGFRFDIEQFLLSPDFHNGWWHKWVHIALVFCL